MQIESEDKTNYVISNIKEDIAFLKKSQIEIKDELLKVP
jgi:hypothetical protein